MNTRLKEIRDYLGVYIPKDMIDVELSRTANELLDMLERVAELPEKWKSKDRYDHYDTSSESKTMTKCANELQAILEDKP